MSRSPRSSAGGGAWVLAHGAGKGTEGSDSTRWRLLDGGLLRCGLVTVILASHNAGETLQQTARLWSRRVSEVFTGAFAWQVHMRI